MLDEDRGGPDPIVGMVFVHPFPSAEKSLLQRAVPEQTLVEFLSVLKSVLIVDFPAETEDTLRLASSNTNGPAPLSQLLK